MIHKKPSGNRSGKTGINRLFWDIETSPNVVLAWRAGYDQTILHDSIIQERKIISIAWKWQGSPKVYSLRWDKDQDDKVMLTAFSKVIALADEAVAHFGDRFDLPWIQARMIHHGLPPIPKTKTIDTKAWASKNFYFNSNKLDYLADFLGIGRKLHTDYDLWKDIVLKQCPKALDRMVKYNEWDVVLLEKVYLRLAEWVAPKSHAGVAAGLAVWTCPRTGSTNVHKVKTRTTASGVVQHQMQEAKTGTYYTISNSAYLKYLESRKCKKGRKR